MDELPLSSLNAMVLTDVAAQDLESVRLWRFVRLDRDWVSPNFYLGCVLPTPVVVALTRAGLPS